MADNNRTTSSSDEILLINNSSQREVMPKVYVEPCQTEFFYDKFKQSYPMFKNPRGMCLIVNIYQIDNMPPRRWSNRDTESLKQLFEQLLFTVKAYTDFTHDLGCQNFKKIIKDFSELPEHQDSQCCVICLMSHGEEGYLTTKEGDKVLLDEIFTLFNNANCPNLAGKPKLFFIQSCRDDPVSGPAEDLGIRLSFNLLDKDEATNSGDETDSHQMNKESDTLTDSNYPSLDTLDNNNSAQAKICHKPTLSDILVGYPTQRGYIAYRKPEVGSWYMNAIVAVFSRHACDTDLCALLNMVNSLISDEVTNTGKKQMSEYTSKLTKPYFYFFPGLATETAAAEASQEAADCQSKENVDEGAGLVSTQTCKGDQSLYQPACKKQRLDILLETNGIDTGHLLDNLLQTGGSAASHFISRYGNVLSDQGDSNGACGLKWEHLDFVAARANLHWKPIAREVRLFSEAQILELERSARLAGMGQKLKYVLQVWLGKELEGQGVGSFKAGKCLDSLLKILTTCRLNKVKEELLKSI